MSVKFFSVRSGEVRHADSEPMIAAFFNSSDLNPNGIVQDYGWRIHPKMAKRIKEMEADEEFVEKLADKLQIPVENVATYHILKYISDRDDKAKAKQDEVDGNQYQEQYERELAEALAADELDEDNTPTSATDPVKKTVKSNKPRVATPREVAAQKKIDDEKLAKMIAEDDKKGDN